jgi:hypothetical protein
MTASDDAERASARSALPRWGVPSPVSSLPTSSVSPRSSFRRLRSRSRLPARAPSSRTKAVPGSVALAERYAGAWDIWSAQVCVLPMPTGEDVTPELCAAFQSVLGADMAGKAPMVTPRSAPLNRCAGSEHDIAGGGRVLEVESRRAIALGQGRRKGQARDPVCSRYGLVHDVRPVPALPGAGLRPGPVRCGLPPLSNRGMVPRRRVRPLPRDRVGAAHGGAAANCERGRRAVGRCDRHRAADRWLVRPAASPGHGARYALGPAVAIGALELGGAAENVALPAGALVGPALLVVAAVGGSVLSVLNVDFAPRLRASRNRR